MNADIWHWGELYTSRNLVVRMEELVTLSSTHFHLSIKHRSKYEKLDTSIQATSTWMMLNHRKYNWSAKSLLHFVHSWRGELTSLLDPAVPSEHLRRHLALQQNWCSTTVETKPWPLNSKFLKSSPSNACQGTHSKYKFYTKYHQGLHSCIWIQI